MLTLQVPISDARRSRKGNRTIRMPLTAWKRVKDERYEPEARRTLRGMCRVPPPLESMCKLPRQSDAVVLHNLIHHCGLGTPLQVRKRFSPIIRALIEKMRERRIQAARCLVPGSVSHL